MIPSKVDDDPPVSHCSSGLLGGELPLHQSHPWSVNYGQLSFSWLIIDDDNEKCAGMSPVFKQTHSFLYLPSYFAVVIFLVEVTFHFYTQFYSFCCGCLPCCGQHIFLCCVCGHQPSTFTFLRFITKIFPHFHFYFFSPPLWPLSPYSKMWATSPFSLSLMLKNMIFPFFHFHMIMIVMMIRPCYRESGFSQLWGILPSAFTVTTSPSVSPPWSWWWWHQL